MSQDSANGFDYLTETDIIFLHNNRCTADKMQEMADKENHRTHRERIKSIVSNVLMMAMHSAEAACYSCSIQYSRIRHMKDEYANDVIQMLVKMGYTVAEVDNASGQKALVMFWGRK